MVLIDENVVDHEQLNAIDVVKGDFSNAGQFQIIIGSGTVNEVFKEFVKLVGVDEVSKAELKREADKKLNPIQRAVKILSDVFVPIIPALVASGLLMGINNILTAQGLFFEKQSLVEAWPAISDLASMINTFASAAYAFLPVLVGFSATKIFGGNPYLGAALGMIMVSGDLLNAYGYGNAILNNEVPTWNIFGLSIEKVGYQGTILPILVSSFILAKLESWLHKKIPEALDTLVTPMLSILMTAFITFLVVGGMMRTTGDFVTQGILWARDTLGIFGGALFGFFYAPLTLTGMHHSLLPVDIQLIAKGGSFLFAIAACNNVAQGGRCLNDFIIK
ncbi:PTS transporter subunit EIIC [Streptococcus cuniculi]|uniref:PTS transporter subunit EIIC n=1 Tax=Streptococcus cuniculi TaxID=1432788 RepID=UPI002241021E|nr:PTS transporter subunit EIIC [Streptococcus cuniculi]